jgi:hypothetical protein
MSFGSGKSLPSQFPLSVFVKFKRNPILYFGYFIARHLVPSYQLAIGYRLTLGNDYQSFVWSDELDRPKIQAW